MSVNCININKLSHSSRFDGISHIHTKIRRMTVAQLIGELKKYSPDEKVYMYDEDGDLYNIVRVMKDKRRLVVF